MHPSVEQLLDRIAPATFTVINLDDSGAGSLRQAVLDAEAASGADVIDFDGAGAAGVIELSSPIAIDSEVAIVGPGAGNLTVSGEGVTGVFVVDGSDPISISGLTIADGYDDVLYGGGIVNLAAALSINNLVFENNFAVNGGAIFNADGASLNAQTCQFLGNTAGVAGGAIFNNNGAVTLGDCTFDTNSVPDSEGQAGAVFNSTGGALDVVNSTFTGNSAGESGGALYNQGRATIAGTTIANNETTINPFGHGGGGILNYTTGVLSMRDCAIVDNTSVTIGGGIVNGVGSAGAVVVLINCTLAGNTAQNGGAIYNIHNSRLAISSSTIADNSSDFGGGGIWNDSFDFALANTIVVRNTFTGGSPPDDIDGYGAADGARTRFNVIGEIGFTNLLVPDNGLTDGVNDNQVGVSVAAANLGSLGGPAPQTVPLLPGSVAIGAGSAMLTSLSEPIAAFTPSFEVSDAYFLGVGQVVQVEDELMQITGLSGTTVSVGDFRGVNGSLAAGHLAGKALGLPNDQRGTERFRLLPIDVGAYQTAPPYSIVTPLPNGTIGQAYDRTLVAVGSPFASEFDVTSGTPPPGLSLNQTTGQYDGVPTATGVYVFTVTATDTSLAETDRSYSLTIHAAPSITTTTLADAYLDKSYSQTIAVNGGTTPISRVVVSGTLPDGMSLDEATGVLSGVPRAAGDFSFTVDATDAAGAVATQAYTLRVVMTLTARTQLGSEVYGAQVAGHVPTAQTATYRLALAAGQKLSVTAQTAPSLQGTVQILNPSNQSVASATASSAGATVFVQNVAATVSGVYAIVIGGAGGSSGDFRLSLDLGAQREAEAAGAATNNSIATAESITGSFAALDSLVSRAAIVSASTYAAAAVTPEFDDISTTGTLSVVAVGDNAAATLTAGQLSGFTFPFFGTTYDSVSFSTNGLITFGAANPSPGHVDLAAAFGAPAEPAIAPLWADTIVDVGGVYYEVVGSGPTQQLIVQWHDVELVDDVGNLFTYQAILSVDGTIQFNYDAGLTAAAVNGSTVGLKDAGLANGANVVVNVDGIQPAGDLVGAGQSVRFTPASSGADYYSLSLSAGDVVSVSLAAPGSVSVDLRNASDTVLATGAAGPTNLTAVIDRYTATTTGTYYVRVAGDSKVTYTITVAKGAAFDGESNGSFATAQNLTGAKGAVGYLEEGSTTNGYAVAAVPYDFIDISLPGAGTLIGEFAPENFENDDNSVQLEFPPDFEFPLYGTTHDHIWVATNGVLTFGEEGFTTADNATLETSPEDATVAPFWDDLIIDGRATSGVYYAYLGSGPSRQLVVQWNDASFYADKYVYFDPEFEIEIEIDRRRGGLTFQAILSADGTIRFNYKSLTTGNNDGIYDEGMGATAGIKAAGNQGDDRLVLIGDSEPGHEPGPGSFVYTGKSVQITPDRGPDWYAVTLSGSQSNLRVSTSTPGDNANQWGNSLNPKIDVFNSSNVLVASGTVGGDGRNESLLLNGLTPSATYKIRVVGEASSGEYFLGASATGTPAIDSVTVNGGPVVARNRQGAAPNIVGQSSVVAQLLVTFNQIVTLDANAFNVASLTVPTSQVAVPSTATVAVVATGVPGTGDDSIGYSQYVLTFVAGAGVVNVDNSTGGDSGNAFTTLADGFYQLNAVGSRIHVGGVTAANSSEKFWALYGAHNPSDVLVSLPLGDANDELRVDGIALTDMYSTFGSSASLPGGPPPYLTPYDSDLDGDVDGIDLSRFYANFGTIWQF